MTKLTFPMGIKTILTSNKRIFIKAQPFVFDKEITQFKELFKTDTNKNKTKNKVKKIKFNKNKTKKH